MGISKTIPWRRFATPDAEFTYASTGTDSDGNPDTMRFDISGKNGGEQIQIDWGDGTFETLNLTTSIKNFRHDYTTPGNFTIRMFQADQKFDFIGTNNNGQLQGDVANLPLGGAKYNFRLTALSGDIQNLPDGASVYRFRNTSVTGDIQNLPVGASEYRFGRTSVTGDIQNLPDGASVYLFSNTSVTGDIQNLPVGASEYRFRNTSVTGDIQNLPVGASEYRFGGTSVTGDIQNLPSGASVYNFRDTSVTGEIQNLPSGASVYNFRDTSVTGDIQNLPDGASVYFFDNTNVTGDIASYRSLSNILVRYLIKDTSVSTYTSGNYSVDVTGADIQVQDLGLSSTEVDNFLIDLEASGASSGTLNIAGNNAARTSSSDAAVSALQNRGWSITVNT